MSITNFLSLLGGLALFLYGMQMMSNGLEAAAGDRMKEILEKLTSNRILGVLVGAGITAVIQSSSATTVMVVGFVNAGMMNLRQAVWIIMGANIGTTITGQLIALDIGAIAPLIAFIGVAMVVFIKKPMVHHVGTIFAGLGVLFIGMEMMSTAMLPLREEPAFIELMTSFSNPLLGILAGALFTAIIQSSSASVGILQALARSGLIGLDGAVYVLFGQNIGTCITAVLASIGTGREAKQTTVIHLTFNLIGTAIFTTVCVLTAHTAFSLTDLVASWTPGSPDAQIANMHTMFNVVTTLILLPFGTYLAAFAQKVLPYKEEKTSEVLQYLKPLPSSTRSLGTSAISVQQVDEEINHMLSLAYENVEQGFGQLLKYDKKIGEEILKREETVDTLNREIADYITNALSMELNNDTSAALSIYYHQITDIERISDYAVKMENYSKDRLQARLNEEERDTIDSMHSMCMEMYDARHDIQKSETLRRQSEDVCVNLRKRQMQRMKEKSISSEISMMFSQLLTDFERINGHALNIAEDYEIISHCVQLQID
ncbi:Na/Pi cotransporter family protein [Amedibacillus dolichus]|uniref:Na/Pi cotransporter family protein n=1 Tax=Amedibacillus dolichus TaxID=31971 RepID=A0ABT7UBI4_9FIRM|nr:Na/Pi cotransporter family protein [Amedibacillus dolichus]MDM8156967.1 Na/Pi cotransporter family protein [Amedibacillus dolichus]